MHDAEKELRKYKERISSDFEFKFSQLEQKYKQQYKHLENLLKA